MKLIKHAVPALALALLLGTAASARDIALDAAPLKIADLRAVDLSLDGAALAKSASRQWEIRTPDAAFIKVHFDRFDLPEGVTLEVASPDGREVYRYSKSARDAHTVSPGLGQDGKKSFSAMSISGPVAVLRLVGAGEWKPSHGVRVTRVLEGYPEDMLPALQAEGLLDKAVVPTAICGVDDKKAVACYSGTEPAAVDRSRPVARLVMSGGGLCTAWRVGSGNHVFTNNHCVASTADVAGSEVWFNYQKATCGGTDAVVTKVPGAALLKTDTTLDYSLFTVNNFANISSFGYLGLDVRRPNANELIYISGHPGGRQKELSIVSDQDGGGYCKINAPVTNGNGTNTDSGYYCDTEGGNSGSPVLARSSNKVIALHHLGGCNNTGARFELIWPQVSSFFGGVVPEGDNGTTPPPPPPSPATLQNGVPLTGLAAGAGTALNYTMQIPADAGANGLKFVMSGGTGDADMYVKYGSAPTDTVYDCRPYANGNAETCTMATTQAGTYYVRLKAYTSFSGVSLTGSYATGPGGGQTYSNSADYAIGDNTTVDSPITVSGRSGNAPATASVSVNIVHTYQGDLKVDLVAPDGSLYNLHNRTGAGTDNVVKTVTLNLSTELLNGTWKMRVNDNAAGDTGYINSWSITF
jgi:V8-like Glu-specific endopeptidase